MENVMEKFEAIKNLYKKPLEEFYSEINDEKLELDIPEITDTEKNNLKKILENINIVKKYIKECLTTMKKNNEVINNFNKIVNEMEEIEEKLNKFVVNNKIITKKENIIKLIKNDDEIIKIFKLIEKLNNENLILENEIAECNKKIHMNEKEIIKFFKNNMELTTEFLTDSTNISKCKICYTNKVNICLNPCGHLFCEECLKECRTSNCSICRKPINSKIKIFNLEDENDENDEISPISEENLLGSAFDSNILGQEGIGLMN